MSYIRGLGAIDISPCTQNPNDPVCQAFHASAPTTAPSTSSAAAAAKKSLPIVPLALAGVVAIAAIMMLRAPRGNPRSRRARRNSSGSSWTVVVPHRDGVRRIAGYKTRQAATFAGQMFGVPFTVERGNPRRRR